MNSRYLIVLLLLGGIVYGLTTAVGGMLAEDEPMSVCSAQVEWSSVPNVGVSAPAERSFSVPASSRHGSSLFHHPAMYSGVSVPQGCSGSGLTTGVPSSGTYAVSSAYSPSQGLYLASSAVLQSYGGGAESGMYASSGSHSAVSSVSPSSADVSLGAMSVSPVAYSPSYSSVSPSYALAAAPSPSAMPYTSAPHRNGPRRAPGTIGGNDEWVNWFDWYVNQEDATGGWTVSGGTYYFTEEQLRAAYEYWKNTQSSTMPTIHSFEDWLAWITGDSNNSRYQLAPIGDGMYMLLWLAVVYAVAVLYKQYRMSKKSIRYETYFTFMCFDV